MKTSVQNLPLENLIRPEELMEEIGIKKDTFYKDLKFLGIIKVKDENGLLCITKEDAERIRALRQHIQETGKRQGFDNNDIIIKENLDDNSDVTLAEKEDNLALNNNNSSDNLTEDSALIKSNENNSSLKTQNDDDDIYVEPEEPTDNMNIDGLVRKASELKAREIAMPELVTRAIADKMTEDDLPFDLKEKVNLAREAANPKFTPNMVAKTILARYRQGRVG